VLTFDEWHSVGKNPVVIYGESGRVVAELSLADLKLGNHPNWGRNCPHHWSGRCTSSCQNPHAFFGLPK
jgi:hypothetical protein